MVMLQCVQEIDGHEQKEKKFQLFFKEGKLGQLKPFQCETRKNIVENVL